MFLLVCVSFVVCIGLCLDTEYVTTPHGMRPTQCVLELKYDDSIIKTKFGGVEVYSPSNKEKTFYPKIQTCNDNAQLILSRKSNDVNTADKIWGSTFVAHPVSVFETKYYIPINDPVNENQILYYFIGLEDHGVNTFNENNATVLSPVISYNKIETNKYIKGWSMSSWDCCQGGYSFYTKQTQLNNNDYVDAKIENNRLMGHVNVTMILNKNDDTLIAKNNIVIKNDYRRYNWAIIMGKFYNYNDCDGLNNEPFTFENILLKNNNNNKINPNWDVYNDIPSCKGGLTFSKDNSKAKLLGKEW